jgi:type IV pilus assembly protein PilW
MNMASNTGTSMQRRPAGADFRAAQRGFTLAEVLVALGIAAILMSALATIFASTVTTRQQVLRDGQKIESARFSLDTLSEDIRLAGYWGNYTPAGGWASVKWQAVTAFEKDSTATCKVTPLTAGFKNLGEVTAMSAAMRTALGIVSHSVTLPVPILGFEAHSGGVTQALTTNMTPCLPSYLPGTDVLVIRRARTTQATAGALTAAKTYLQPSGCSSEIGSNDFRVGLGTATFNLTRLGCASTPVAPIWELITRVYYVASENESGDAVPTLKMIDLSGGSSTPVTIAPGVVDFHLEYGLDVSGTEWKATTAVTAGEVRHASCNWTYATDPVPTPYKTTCRYTSNSAGNTGTISPSLNPRISVAGTTTVSDGAITWTYAGLVDGSVDDYAVSATSPQRYYWDAGSSDIVTSTPAANTRGTALGSPWGSGMGWEDVVAVKLWVVVRDIESTAGYTNSKTYVLGSISIPAATINARAPSGSAAYRYKSSGATVKVVNSSGRREDSIP